MCVAFRRPPLVDDILRAFEDKQEVFSPTGVWRGPLSGLPKSTLLPLTSRSSTTLGLVALPKGDDGSLVLSLARAQLSVPLLRGGRFASASSAAGDRAVFGKESSASTSSALDAACAAAMAATTAAAAGFDVAYAATAASAIDTTIVNGNKVNGNKVDGTKAGAVSVSAAPSSPAAATAPSASTGDWVYDPVTGYYKQQYQQLAQSGSALAPIGVAPGQYNPATAQQSLNGTTAGATGSTPAIQQPQDDTGTAASASCAAETATNAANGLGVSTQVPGVVVAASNGDSGGGETEQNGDTLGPSACKPPDAGGGGGAGGAVVLPASANAAAVPGASQANGGEDKGQQDQHQQPVAHLPSKAPAAAAAAAAAEMAKEEEQARETWGLDTDAIALLTESRKGGGGAIGREERQRLARSALRAGDVDRLLLCLGRLEGEPPPVHGGRADRFDDPAAVAERMELRQAAQGKRGETLAGVRTLRWRWWWG